MGWEAERRILSESRRVVPDPIIIASRKAAKFLGPRLGEARLVHACNENVCDDSCLQSTPQPTALQRASERLVWYKPGNLIDCGLASSKYDFDDSINSE